MTSTKVRPRTARSKAASYDEARAIAKARKKARELSELRAAVAALPLHPEMDGALGAVMDALAVAQEGSACDDPMCREVAASVARARRGLHRRAMVEMHAPAAAARELLLDADVRPRLAALAGAFALVTSLFALGVPVAARLDLACKWLAAELEHRAARDRVPDVDRLVMLALEACGWPSQDAEVLARAVPLTPPPSRKTT